MRRTAIVGFPIVSLVEQLSNVVSNSLGMNVHWGATTQDIMDTALILQIRDFLDIQEKAIAGIIGSLTALAKKHRTTIMTGRSQMHHALPITFGYKIALWVSPFKEYLAKLSEIRSRVLKVQFGGAVGTLASLGKDGEVVRRRLAEELDLITPAISWHTSRENLVEIMQWLTSVAGSLGKIGKDIVLLSQTEIGELKEKHVAGRGTSSTMPQKQNPISAQALLIAAKNTANQMSLLYDALLNDHERGTSVWQLEWTAIHEICIHCAGSTGVAVELFPGLQVITDKMKQNLEITEGGIMAEAIMMKAAEKIGRQSAHDLVHEIILESQGNGIPFGKAIFGNSELSSMFSKDQINKMLDYSNYLGDSLKIVDGL